MNTPKAKLWLAPSKEFVIFICILLFIFKIPLFTSLKLALFVLLLIWSGSNFIEKIWKRPLASLEKYSTGLITGVTLLLTIDFFIRRIELSHWVSLLIIIFVGCVSRINSTKSILSPVGFGATNSYDHFLVAFSIALLSFNFRALWAIPIGISFFFWGDPRSHRRLYSIGFLVLGLALLLLLDDDWQLAISNDAGFYESLSWSIIEFGPSDHPGFSGGFAQGSLSSYHTTAYSFSGLTSFFSGLEPYVFINQLGPLFNSFVLASCCLSLFRTKLSSFEFALIAMLATFFLASGSYNSLTFGLVVLFVFVKVNFDLTQIENALNWNVLKILPPFLIGLLTVFSKGTMLLPVLAITATSIAFHVFNKSTTKESLKILVIRGAIIACFIFLAWLKFFRVDTALGGGISTGSSLWSSLQDFGLTQTILTHCFRLFTLVSALIVLGLNFYKRKRNQSDLVGFIFWLNSSLFAALALFILFIRADSRVDEYVVSAHLGLMIVFTCLKNNFIRNEHDSKSDSLMLPSLCFVFFLIFIYVPVFRLVLIPRSEGLWQFLTSNSPAGKLPYFLATESMWLSALMIGSLAVLLLQLINKVLHKQTPLTILFCLLVPLFAAATLRADSMLEYFVDRSNSRDSLYISSDGSNSAANPSTDLKALGEFVRRNTPFDSIFASNNFCCSGESWFDSVLKQPTYTGESALGGANYLLPASLKRRFLIQGPRFQINCCIDQFPDQIERIRLSLMFANQPSSLILDALKQQSVDYFVVNKTLTELDSWKDFATTVYENEEFLLLRIQ